MPDSTNNKTKKKKPAFDPDAGLFFSSTVAVEKGFTNTPANVKSDYVEGSAAQETLDTTATPVPPVRESTSQSKKRKVPADSSPAEGGALKKSRTKPTTTTTTTTTSSSSSPNGPDPKKTRTHTRTRKPNQKNASTRMIPTAFEQCRPEDQMLITMRDNGSEWRPIREKWFEMTGEPTGNSSLPNRYNRLKMSFTHIEERDEPRLLQAKREVEESFEQQKWDLVAKVVQEKGGAVYAGIALQRQYKKMMMEGGAVPPPGVRDADFEVEEVVRPDDE